MQLQQHSDARHHILDLAASATLTPPPDPRVLAERAVEEMRLRAIDMGIAPLPMSEQ